jgi:predicted nucleic acid-binding Zn ribbon protein
MAGMARHQFTPARALLPQLLTRLSKETGRGGHLKPVWEEIVGPVAARHSTPVGLAGKTLIVEVQTPRWAAALEAQDPEIRSRLDERLGAGAITQIAYRSRSSR